MTACRSDLTPPPQHLGCELLHRAGVRQCQGASNGHCREFVLRIVQPALVGLMDGSVSTLAPIFASAYATGQPRVALLIGLASSTGAGISMAMSEALSDDGSITGRGSAFMRGGITGLATFLGGILHTLPFLIPTVGTALAVAYAVVGLELVVISWIRYRFLRTSFWKSIVQVVFGGLLVLAAGILLGRS